MPPARNDPITKKKSTPVPGQTGGGSGPSPKKTPMARVVSSHGKSNPDKNTPAANDVQSSGGDYGTKKANAFKKTPKYRHDVVAAYRTAPAPARKQASGRAQAVYRPSPEQAAVLHEHRSRIGRNQELLKAGVGHDVLGNEDLHTADLTTLARHYEEQNNKKSEGGLLGFAHGVADVGAKVGGTVLFHNIVGAAALVDKVGGTNILPTASKTAGNFGREMIDIPSAVVPSTYALAKTAKEDPAAAWRMIKQPYIDLYKHPGKTLTEHPLSSLLMVLPAGKFLARGVGRAGTEATLANTGVIETRAASGIRGRANQTITRTMKDSEINRRVDENRARTFGQGIHPHEGFAYEFSKKHRSSTPDNIKPQAYKDRNAALGAANRESAATGVEHSPFEVGGTHVIVPSKALEQHITHEAVHAKSVGKSRQRWQSYSAHWRKVVLSTSPKWLTGNVVEAGLRTVVSRSGMMDYTTGTRALRALKRSDPQKYAEFKAGTIAGGHMKMASSGLEETRAARAGESLGNMARGAGKVVTGHPLDGARQMFKGYTGLVMDSLNGNLESQFQTAMLGQALRKNKLVPRGMAFRSQKAFDEALNGLKNTNNQVKLGRDIDRMYGKYGKFSPDQRYAIATYTPFLAWTRNTLEFLGKTLPSDHPVLTSAIAANNQATEEWRKQHGQMFELGNKIPRYLQGGIPGKGGTVLRLSHYTPFGIFEAEGGLTGNLADLLMPQVQTVIKNAAGLDWKNDKLKHDDEISNIMASVVSAVEQTIPFIAIAGDIAGVHRPNVAKQTFAPTAGERAQKRLLPFEYTASKKPSTDSGRYSSKKKTRTSGRYSQGKSGGKGKGRYAQ